MIQDVNPTKEFLTVNINQDHSTPYTQGAYRLWIISEIILYWDTLLFYNLVQPL